jgi:hypothetical protein
MNLPPFPDDYIPTSPEARRRLIAWGMDCARGELEELRRDAERYRWLRDECGDSTIGAYQHPWDNRRRAWLSGSELDAAIDAARVDEGMGNGDPQG